MNNFRHALKPKSAESAMAPDVQSSKTDIGVVRGTGSTSELKRSSHAHRRSSSKGKEKVLPPRGFETVKYPEKLKEDNYKNSKLRDRHGKATADDELVKHMSNLPQYLQRMERGENQQGKALNFGVLDWTLLEKWKLNQNSDLNKPIGSSNSCNATQVKAMPQRSDLPCSSSQRPSVFDNNGFNNHGKRPTASKKVISVKDTETASKLSSVRIKQRLPEETTAHRGVGSDKGCSLNNVAVDIRRTDHPRKTAAETESSSVAKHRKGLSETESSRIFPESRKVKPRELDVNLTPQPSSGKPKSIVLLMPRRFPHSETSKQKEGLTEACSTSLCDSVSSEELYSREFFPEATQSCPVSAQLESQKNEPETEAAKLSFADTLNRLDQEHESAEGRRSRNPSSPNRRFSFSLGKMTRSFSFKESRDSIPQLGSSYVSAKSGPVTTTEAKTPAKGGRSSSPLRRLLNPILKSRSTSFSETIEPPVKPMDLSGQQQQQQQCTVQALLQATVKNGQPTFKFVVENSSKVLAATMKNSSYSSTRSLTFYSVDEIKKKSISWMGQGNKVKGSDFVYKVVGQMTLSDPPFEEQNISITKECVLSSLEPKESTNLIQPRELAAIVFRVPKNSVAVSANVGSMTVILPGGVHGLPSKGEPSPLIVRWRSGGSCDCGGWDIGCKLRVLSNQDKKGSRSLWKSNASSVSDHLQLWTQGGVEESKSVLRVAPFRKGIYSVEFDSSISLLQAFSISAAFIICQAKSDFEPPESNSSVEPILGRIGTVKRGDSIFQIGGHSKYAPCPPLSPVGRV